MSIQITLPAGSAGDRIIGGIAFVGVTAEVPSLSANRRAFFDHLGATIVDTTIPTPTSPDEVAALTVGQLRALAGARGIQVGTRDKHDELVSTITGALFPDQQGG